MSAADPYEYEEAAINYRLELAEEIRAFALTCRNERLAEKAWTLWAEVDCGACSLLFGEQEFAMLEYDYTACGLDYGDLEFREGGD